MKIDKSISHVLVVEDNPGDFALVDDFLMEKFTSPHVTQAETFAEARKYLKSGSQNYDLVLLDLSLPDKAGEDLIAEMTALCGVVPVIVLTGYSDFSFGIRSLSLGAADYILKDELTPMTLHKSIRYALERKKAMSALAESEKKYSELFHLSPLPMFVFAFDGLSILNVNKSAIKHYGYTKDEFLGMTIKDICKAGDMSLLEESLMTSKQYNKLMLPGPYRHCKKNGEIIHVEIQGNSMTYRGIEAKVVLIIDVTERLNYIGEIEIQNEKLREISWIQSHMVRAPLARLLGLIALIRDVKDNSGELQYMMNYLEVSANELDQVVREITSKTVIPEIDPLLKQAI
ncbi:response regulator [Mucilaginibacter sp. BT774]|uniref:response regulator n=1 Tax=Mucilaginibacter sp. BT774 TaxID=3062276 RepID=UPI0026774A3E|nr:response regulator [Mucilaginibacter sp. BT774]MDO3625789.1 response regulator [Mucilaginibacter sp. BT774]